MTELLEAARACREPVLQRVPQILFMQRQDVLLVNFSNRGSDHRNEVDQYSASYRNTKSEKTKCK